MAINQTFLYKISKKGIKDIHLDVKSVEIYLPHYKIPQLTSHWHGVNTKHGYLAKNLNILDYINVLVTSRHV